MPLRFFILLSATVTIATANAAEIRIAVSDLIASGISDTIRELAESESINVSVVSTGSLPAIDALRAEEISLAIVATPEGDQKLSDEEVYAGIPFAYSAAIVVVNEANPINEISFHSLRGIFGSDPDFQTETWGDLGIKSLRDRRIKALVAKSEVGISAELFRHQVLEDKAMKLTVSEAADLEIEEMIVKNPVSVAILPHLPNNEAIKALMVSIDPKSPAFGPNDDNVYYGDYPIRLPFQIAYRKDDEIELEAIFRILLSDEITEALCSNHLFVPPEAIRTSLRDSLVRNE